MHGINPAISNAPPRCCGYGFAEKVQDWRDEWGEAVYHLEDADAREAESARLMEEAGMV